MVVEDITVSESCQASPMLMRSILTNPLIERKMSEFDKTILDQEPDCIAFIPSCPGYTIIGTYSLSSEIRKDEDNALKETGNRVGSLQILPVRPSSNHQSSERPLISLARQDFLFGVYDIQFHPQDQSLLGVATSNAEILFYRVLPQYSSSGALTAIEFIEVGKIIAEEPHGDDGRLAIITQFQFLDFSSLETHNESHTQNVLLSATTQFGNTKLIKVAVPPVGASESEMLEYQMIDIHKQSFDLEAWTVLPILTDLSTLCLLSGGDDSQLIVSKVSSSANESFNDPELDLDLLTTVPQHTDKRIHEAGVVYICTLGRVPSQKTDSTQQIAQQDDLDYLILTGSYDERIRLFLFTPSTPERPRTGFSLMTELNLGGGVWRIIPLDTYETREGRDHILLVAAHTAGACIVRLSCMRSGQDGWNYEFTIDRWFKEGHESIVYAVTAKRVIGLEGAWDIVSASFYDKAICQWRWVDEKAEKN